MIGEKLILLVLFPASIPIFVSLSRNSTPTLIVWDTQTGVVVRTFHTKTAGKIMFHGDQRTITLVSRDQDVYTYDVLDGRWVCQGRTNSPFGSELGTTWTSEETLWFTILSGPHKEPTMYIYELQPTPSLHVLSSFPLTLLSLQLNLTKQIGKFSFSPVSFHASFVTMGEVIVLNVQDSNLLLRTELDEGRYIPGQFSPDGCFFISGPLQNEIHIWQNTPIGYVPWRILQPQVELDGYQWSPSSNSILCWGLDGIRLLHPGNYSSPPLSNRTGTLHFGGHLVAYSADKTYIATVRMFGGIVTVLNCISGTSWQFTDTEMEIEDIKIVNNTIIVVDSQELVGWVLEADGIVYGAPSARRVTVDETLPINDGQSCLTLSHDCSQIAYGKGSDVVLYDITQKTQKTIHIHSVNSVDYPLHLLYPLFSPDKCQLWFVGESECYLVELGAEQDQGIVELSVADPEDGWIMFNHSSHGYHIRAGSGWVTDSRDRKLLWLPPSWRTKYLPYTRWDGNFLALCSPHHPGPIVIKFHI